MYTIDEREWPLVTLESHGAATMEDMDVYFAAWERWLERGEADGHHHEDDDRSDSQSSEGSQ